MPDRADGCGRHPVARARTAWQIHFGPAGDPMAARAYTGAWIRFSHQAAGFVSRWHPIHARVRPNDCPGRPEPGMTKAFGYIGILLLQSNGSGRSTNAWSLPAGLLRRPRRPASVE